MTEEEIMKTWEAAARKLYSPSPDELTTLLRHNKETALERLAQRYRRFSFLGVAMIFCSLGWLLTSHLIPDAELRLKTTVVMMCYFASCSIIDAWFYRGISSINCFTMTVKEVVEKAIYYRKKHLQSMMILFPFAIMVVGMMIYAFGREEAFLYGVIAGALVGVIIGYYQFSQFMKEYKIIREE